MFPFSLPEPSQIARVRQRHHLVEQVEPPTSASDDTIVRLSCVGDDAQGQPLEVLWNHEIDAERRQTIESELEALRSGIGEVYVVKAQRIEPVGLVYLWPVTG